MPSQKVKAVGAQYPYGEPRISLDTYAGAEEHLLQEYQKKAEGGCPTTAKRDVVLAENIWEGRDVVEGWGSLHPWMLWRGGVPHIHWRGGMLWKGGVSYIHGCCEGVGFPTSIIIYITIIIIITSVSTREGGEREGPGQLQSKSR